MITFSLLGDLTAVDSFLRAVLKACHAGNAFVAKDYCIAGVFDVTHRADLGACSAHDAVIIGLKCETFLARDLWPCCVLRLVDQSFGQLLLRLNFVLYVVSDLLCKVF